MSIKTKEGLAQKIRRAVHRDEQKRSGFKRELNTWQLSMLTLGGIMSSGLFLAGGTAIRRAGPSVLLTYLFGFLLMAFEMIALVEMTASDPVPGSIYVYADRALGQRWSFTMGWVFWFSSLTTMSTEVTAAALFSQYWFPAVPIWFFSLAYTLLVVVVNLLSVRGYAEIQQWFSIVKVVAVGLFILLGGAYFLSLFGHPPSPYLTHSPGGFFPAGLAGLAGSLPLIMYGYAGTGSISLAAAETVKPRHTTPATLRSVIITVGLLYLGSALLLTSIFPWNVSPTHRSPFVFALHRMGIPYAGAVFNFVIITAVLSSMNAALYGVGRMLYSLAKDDQAPRWFAHLNTRSIPQRAILASSVFLVLGVILAFLLPRQAYVFLSTGTGTMGMLIWIFIIASQIRYRAGIKDRLAVRTPWFPWLSWIAIAGIVVVYVGALAVPDEAIGLAGGLGISALFLVAFSVVKKIRSA